MFIKDLNDMRAVVDQFFGEKADYQGTYTSRGYVLFDLYGIFPVRFVILDKPYNTLEIQREVTQERVTHIFLDQELMFIENTEDALTKAFETADQYFRLRLPNKFLESYETFQHNIS